MSKNTTPFYNPSWIDRFINWIKGLPGPSWGYYVGLGVILLAVQTAVFWGEGAIPVGTFLPVHIFLTAAVSFIIAILSYFDDLARISFETIKPELTIDDDKFQKLEYQLTNLPMFPSIMASILALIFLFTTEMIGGGPYHVEALIGYPISSNISRAAYLLSWWFFGVFIYHTIHQLGLINQIYISHTMIDLFRMKPLYGFSNLAAITAGSLIMLPYGFLYINPDVQLSDPVVLLSYLFISIIALITFLMPQLGIHRLQKAEQEYLLGEINQRYKATMGEFHKCVDAEIFDQATTLVSVLDALTNQRKTIKGISTWPWQPETFRWLFTAMVLPLLMWIAQHFLGQFFTP
jgi:hypothetical protein